MTAGRLWAASGASLALAILAVYALSSVVAFFVIVAVTVWLAGIVGGLAAVGAWADEHKRADDAEAEAALWREQAETLADELSHADDTIANLAAQVVAQAETYVGDKGTRLRLVEDVDAEWPAIVRAVEGEIGGAS